MIARENTLAMTETAPIATGTAAAPATTKATAAGTVSWSFAAPTAATPPGAAASASMPALSAETQRPAPRTSSAAGMDVVPGPMIVVQRYEYTGRELASESNEYYFRFRVYGPALGQFFTRDPLGYVDGMGLYGGVLAGRMGTDPYGQTWAAWCWQMRYFCLKTATDAQAKQKCESEYQACIKKPLGHQGAYGMMYPLEAYFPQTTEEGHDCNCPEGNFTATVSAVGHVNMIKMTADPWITGESRHLRYGWYTCWRKIDQQGTEVSGIPPDMFMSLNIIAFAFGTEGFTLQFETMFLTCKGGKWQKIRKKFDISKANRMVRDSETEPWRVE